MALPILPEGTYLVPERNMEGMKAKMAALARRAAKLGALPPSYVEEGTHDEPVMKRVEGSTALVPTGKVDRYRIVRAVGSAPKFSGWTFVAALDVLPEVGNMVRVMPGQSLPEKYRTEAPHCDHCKAARNRIGHYVVKSDAGECRMVGSSCIKDFLGHQAPEHILAVAQMVACLGDVMRADYCPGTGQPEYLDLLRFLSYVACSISLRGWLGASRAREEDRAGEATKSCALAGMFHLPKECRTGCLHPTEADRELAAKSIEWAKSIEAKSDFDHNLKVVAQSEVMPLKGAGIAAAMVFCYKREAEQSVLREKKAAQFKDSRHVGEIGKRQDFEVAVVSEHKVEGDYGTTSIYKMVDGAGNCLTWFSSSGCLEEGKSYVLKGTVKAHDEYRGTKQTVVTRCKVLKEIEAVA